MIIFVAEFDYVSYIELGGEPMAKMEVPGEYRERAKKDIKLAMVEHDVTYGVLLDRLNGSGVEFGSEQALRNKISRGTFGADFYLMVLDLCEKTT